MTFCPFWKDCKNGETCDRALTEIVRQNAIKYASGRICQFMDKPDCWKEIVDCEEFWSKR